VWTEVKPWSEEERLRGEKDTLGLYLTGHPFDRYEQELANVATTRLGSLQGDRNRSCTVAGLVVALQIRQTARGAMAFVTLDDRTGRVELKLFNEAYQRFRTLLERDRVLVAVGPVAVDEYSGSLAMTVDELFDLDQTRSRYARALVLHPPESLWGPEFSQALAEQLAPFREGGRCPVLVQWRQGEAQGCLKLGDAWKIQPLHGLMQRLAGWLGERNVRLEYPSAP
ncbi:MAG: OB-fold nucleic acid binding domain-containing protein, partial [Gammaproteobacteria bacterium]